MTDDQVLADLMRRILNNPDSCALEITFSEPGAPYGITLITPPVRLALNEREREAIRPPRDRSYQVDGP